MQGCFSGIEPKFDVSHHLGTLHVQAKNQQNQGIYSVSKGET
jgi:hypothetical protein